MSFWELWYFIPYRFFFVEVCIRWLILLQSTLGTYGKRHRKIRYFLNSVKEKKIITTKVTFYFGLWLFYIIKWLWIWGTFALVLIYHIFLFAGIGKHTKKILVQITNGEHPCPPRVMCKTCIVNGRKMHPASFSKSYRTRPSWRK